MVPYRPEPLTDFASPAEAAAFQAALEQIRKELGGSIPLWIGGRPVDTAQRIISRNPSNGSDVIGDAARADAALAASAVERAHAAFGSWSRTAPAERAGILFKAAALLRRRKHAYSAWLVLEAGKPRAEADADTAEAIDFLDYYGRQMLALEERGRAVLTPLAGERNEMAYLPLGTGVIIAPWNFPLAILAGMTAAAVVAGNTAVVKPSSLTPIIAQQFLKLMLEAGLPEDVISLVTGDGGEIGAALVDHPLTRFIAFTGSKDVGLRIYERAARLQPGQRWLKRFIGELGGKDAILVDRSADLDEAARGIVASAFGYAGQKCSACSRAVVHRDVYDDVLTRCVELTQALRIGDAADETTDVGPVIDERAAAGILRYAEIARQEGRIMLGGGRLARPGYYMEPTIAADVDPRARIMQEEVFGPLVAFAPCRDFDHGLAVVNCSEYGLTGAVYARDRRLLELAKREFHAGNVYVNRKCTGAVVGAHPFGGFNLSGTDSKAGGPDYLQLFTQAKVVSERL